MRHVKNFLLLECLRVGFLVSTYLIRFLGSKLILSINSSGTTLWVLDTCLIVGLRPLIFILMTATLSLENVQLTLTLRRMCVGGYVVHIRQLKNLLFLLSVGVLVWELGLAQVSWMPLWLGCTVLSVERDAPITMSEDKEQVTHPYVVQHPEK